MMKQKLNLAVLNKRKEEMNEKEMNEVKAGSIKCECEVECHGYPTARSDIWTSVDTGENCPCGSIWTIFGLMWG
jgi:hypothetical protein